MSGGHGVNLTSHTQPGASAVWTPGAGRVESLDELLEVGAADSTFFQHYFFPNTARQDEADFHPRLWKLAESNNRLINMLVFRGGAKTSKIRMYAAKRTVYGLSHTVTVVGKSQGHAAASLDWLRTQFEHNKRLIDTFRIRPGKTWTADEFVVYSEAFQTECWFKALGIDGSVRGILKGDYRPDLILLDDPIDDENAATPDQRQKILERIHGALKESLAATTESPDSKLIMLQTPMHKDDASMKALDDPEWVCARFPIWTDETMDLPVEKQMSRWPARYPSEDVRKQKIFAQKRNLLSVFVREKECRIVSRETSSFRPNWLRNYEMVPEQGVRVLWIDPVPPPSEKDIELGKFKNDFECLACVQRTGDDFYVLDYRSNRGHDPSWTATTFLEMNAKWKPLRNYVESVAYQRTLTWLLKKAMEQHGFYYVIEEVIDQRAKFQRILDGLNGPAAMGHLFIRPEMTDFVSQFTDYPNVSNDDVIESIAGCVEKLSDPMYKALARMQLNANDATKSLIELQDDLDYEMGAP